MKAWRILTFLFSTFLLLVALINLFWVPINTELGCDASTGLCAVNVSYFFRSRNAYFSRQEIFHTELVTHGTSHIRGWSIRFKTPQRAFVVGEYPSEDKALKVLERLNAFQKHQSDENLYINGETQLEHIIGTLGSLLIAIVFIWASLKPFQNNVSNRNQNSSIA